MESTVEFAAQHPPLKVNLDALCRLAPGAAAAIARADLPDSAQPAIARDGERTFLFRAEDGRSRWLGGSSVPGVRAEALIDAFDVGTGNVLLEGIGQGAELRRLLAKLAPYQAVFVVEENPGAARLVLGLADYSEAIAAGRLVVLAGDRLWEQYEAFFEANPGYLCPDRILSWPSYRAVQATALAQGVAQRNAAIETRRIALLRGREEARQVSPAATIAIVTNVTEPSTLGVVARLRSAASRLGYTPLVVAPDSPRIMHPAAAESTLQRAAPRRTILLDVAPGGLPFRLADGPASILCTHLQPLSDSWLTGLPGEVGLFVRTPEQREAAIHSGRDPARVHVLGPAADGGIVTRAGGDPTRIAAMVSGRDTSPESVGLHLASHVQIWRKAAELIADRVDTYARGDAEAILRRAQDALGMHIESAQVRAALLERIQDHLGPAVVCEAYLATLRDAMLEVVVVAPGAPYPPAEVLIDLREAAPWRDEILDTMLAGGIVLRRCAPHSDDEPDAPIEAAIRSQWRPFRGRDDLLVTLRAILKEPGKLNAGGPEAAAAIRRGATWDNRLKSILAS